MHEINVNGNLKLTIMKSLHAIFKTKKGNIDPDSVERYYAHGAQLHETHEHVKVTDAVTANAQRYSCPMKCEGEKTYDQPGNCPVCNMKLMPVGNN